MEMLEESMKNRRSQKWWYGEIEQPGFQGWIEIIDGRENRSHIKFTITKLISYIRLWRSLILGSLYVLVWQHVELLKDVRAYCVQWSALKKSTLNPQTATEEKYWKPGNLTDKIRGIHFWKPTSWYLWSIRKFFHKFKLFHKSLYLHVRLKSLKKDLTNPENLKNYVYIAVSTTF